MRAAYIRWVFSKLALNRQPRVKLGARVNLGNWISFSEYWSFQTIAPQSERLFMERLLGARRDEAVAFDVGANIGAFTCLLASYGVAQVHAFEPVPETFCRLKANVAANGLLDRCRLNCLAVGKDRELLTFRVDVRAPATNRWAGSEGNPARTRGKFLQHVGTISLDAYCHATGIQQIDFLKIDVEGMEPFALQGAQQLLSQQRVKAILIEVCPTNLHSVGLTPKRLFEAMTFADYAPHELQQDGQVGQKLGLKDIASAGLTNVALLPPGFGA